MARRHDPCFRRDKLAPAEAGVWKSSARLVKKYADTIVISDGSSFDLDLDRIKLIDGKWALLGAPKRNIRALGVPGKGDSDSYGRRR